MSFSVTYHASHKVAAKGGHLRSHLQHVAREADERAGVFRPHSNEKIEAARTHHNRTLVNDGSGSFRPAASAADIENYVDARLSEVKKPLRANSVAMRGLILQIDPEFFDETSPGWRETGDIGDAGRAYTQVMLDWAAAEFGQANISHCSLHIDETSPQLHVGMLPVTSDGRLSQKDFFKGPDDLKRQHNDLRKALADAGLDVTLERKTSDRTIKRMGDREYKQYRDDLDAADADRKAARSVLAAAEQERLILTAEQTRAQQAQADVERQAQALEDERARLQDATAAERARLDAAAAAVALRERQAQERTREALEALQALEEVADTRSIDRWAAKKKMANGGTLLDMYETEKKAADAKHSRTLARLAAVVDQETDTPAYGREI